MNLSPLERYQRDLARPDFHHDSAQAQAVELLQSLYQSLLHAACEKPVVSWLAQIKKIVGASANTQIKGLYFWGGVGRGKTYLMDNFYESLPFEKKMRVHFHRFMRRVHGDLKKLQGKKNPLSLVADSISNEARVLCFDEFFVSDITDAMILGTLMEELFERGIVLVATSNIAPDGLYKDGLQRARFLPAIALLKQHTQVFNLDGGIDYRLRTLEQVQLYYSPLGDSAEKNLLETFNSLVPCAGEVESGVGLELEGRVIRTRHLAEDVIWFDFVELCDGPRSQNDYIELAREYHSVLLSNVPAMGRDNDDQARRFINLVDEFYDRGVKLVISAQRPLIDLYGSGQLEFEFQRTVSRLREMQSREYLARPHSP